MAQSPLATAADYADAMLVARRVKGILILLLLVMLAVQVALFFLVRTDVIKLPAPGAGAAAATQPSAEPVLELVTEGDTTARTMQAMQYVIGVIDFLGVVCAVLLAIMLLVLVQIMLVGRLIGISHVMAGLVGSLVAALLLFPWQAFLDHTGLTAAQADFKIPGVLYTWQELFRYAHFGSENVWEAVLRWARFVGFPVVTFALLIWVQVRSGRGLKLALGEIEPPMDEFERPTT